MTVHVIGYNDINDLSRNYRHMLRSFLEEGKFDKLCEMDKKICRDYLDAWETWAAHAEFEQRGILSWPIWKAFALLPAWLGLLFYYNRKGDRLYKELELKQKVWLEVSAKEVRRLLN